MSRQHVYIILEKWCVAHHAPSPKTFIVSTGIEHIQSTFKKWLKSETYYTLEYDDSIAPAIENLG